MAASKAAIIFYMKYTKEYCFDVAKHYSVKKDFRREDDAVFQWLRRNGLVEEACSHMQVLHRTFSDDDIARIASNYSYRREFKLGDQSAYQAARKRGILDDVCAHMVKPRRQLSNEGLISVAMKFDTRADLAKSDPGVYNTARKRGILDEVCAHMDHRETRRLEDDEIIQIAKQFNTRNDFKLGDFGAYTTAIRRGLIDAACLHMEYGACGFREDRPAVLYQFRIETTGGDVLYKVGITNRKPRQRLTTMGLDRGLKAELINLVRFDLGRDARIMEKRLASQFADLRYTGKPIMKNGNTELYTAPIVDDETA